MPFREVDIKKMIEEEKLRDPEFKKVWDDSRMEYEVLGQLIKLRKERGLSQAELAKMAGSNQQIISRVEKHEHSPTLKTICNFVKALNAEIRIVPLTEDNKLRKVIQSVASGNSSLKEHELIEVEG